MNTHRTPDRNPNPDTWKGKYDFSKLPEIGDLIQNRFDDWKTHKEAILSALVLSEVEEIIYGTTLMGKPAYGLVFLGMRLYEDGRTDIYEMCFSLSDDKEREDKWVIVSSAQKEEGNETEEG